MGSYKAARLFVLTRSSIHAYSSFLSMFLPWHSACRVMVQHEVSWLQAATRFWYVLAPKSQATEISLLYKLSALRYLVIATENKTHRLIYFWNTHMCMHVMCIFVYMHFVCEFACAGVWGQHWAFIFVVSPVWDRVSFLLYPPGMLAHELL